MHRGRDAPAADGRPRPPRRRQRTHRDPRTGDGDMKVLVTGATGVYGRSVVERLHRAGHEVVAMARNPPKSLPPGVRFAAADVQDLAAVQSAMEGCDVVVHMAFVVTPIKDREQSRAISVGGTQNVVDAVKSSGARRLVFVSSAMSYGANP